MKRFLRTVLVAWCLTFGLVVLAPPQASAGIIVTEGKINQCGVEVESIRAMMILGLWPEDVECPDEASSPSDESEGSGESSDDHGYEGDDLDNAWARGITPSGHRLEPEESPVAPSEFFIWYGAPPDFPPRPQ